MSSIAKVPAGASRPLWSVIIPTYNCARFLREALASVLVQDPGPDQMQIEVVDDCSTADDPEAVVREFGCGRVSFFKKTVNEGAVQNFNTCIERSRGHLIHILHGDDYVLPNFYNVIRKMADEHAECSFFATRTIAVDEEGAPEWMSRRTKSLERPSADVTEIVMSQEFQTPSVVIRRSFYERYGGFDTELIHCADWDMWVRAIRYGGGLVHPEPLARYRISRYNHTNRLLRNGENVLDHLRLLDRLDGLPGFHKARFKSFCANLALTQAHQFARVGDVEAATTNFQIYRSLEPLSKRLVRRAQAAAKRGMRLIAWSVREDL